MEPVHQDWLEQIAIKYKQRGYWKPLTLGEHLRSWAQKYGEHIAVVEQEKRISYSELDWHADELASGLHHLGIQQGDRVLIQLPNSIEFVLSCFALFRLGAIPILCTPANREADIDAFCVLAEPVAYITVDTFLGFDHHALAQKIVSQHPCLKYLISDSEHSDSYALNSLGKPPKDIPSPHYRDTALLLLSGGTTGTPKLIPRTHTDYAYNAQASAERCELNSQSVYLAVLPVAHNFPLACPGVLGTLSVGGRVVLARTPSYDEAFPLIERERVTITSLVPPLVNLWLQACEWDNSDLSSLCVLQVGGSRLEPALAARVEPALGCRLQQVFGMAEGLLCYTLLDDPDDVIVHTQGCPLCVDDEIKIVDEDGHDVPYGEVGELLVRGPYTIRGYYRAAEENVRTFTPDGYFRSGDRVRITSEGNLEVKGRIKDQINRAGEKIAADEIEFHLCSHPGIQDAAVVALPDEHLGERSCAFIMSSRSDLDLPAIHTFLQQRGLPRYKIPDQLESIEAWPLTSAGKIDKRKLVSLARPCDQMQGSASNIRQSYVEQTIPITGDPLIMAALLAESGLSETYLVYEDNGEWSIGIGVAALLTADAVKTCLQINERSYSWQNELVTDSVNTALESVPIDQWCAYGIANFELACHNYNLPCLSKDELLLQIFIPTFEVRLREGSALLRALGEDKLQELIELVTSIDSSAGTVGAETPFDLRIAEHRLEVPEIYTYETDAYQQAVASAVNEICAQQYLKVIISRTIPLSKEIDIVASYIAGRRANTPARSFLLSLDNLKAAGFSPETVVEVTKEGWVSTRPLAGTRSIGCNAEEERKLREELLHNSKEIHEHAISVQLAFEELCSVCSRESVGVCDFMSVCRRSTVQHLASKVKGRLKDGYNAWHAFNALFPAVTATGIPKRESIDAIGRLESQPRNLYSGCVMIVDSDGAMDAALVLRSVFQKDKKAWLHVGAGIVDLSIPARETEETCEKIRSISQQLVYL